MGEAYPLEDSAFVFGQPHSTILEHGTVRSKANAKVAETGGWVNLPESLII